MQHSHERDDAEQDYVDGFHPSILDACCYPPQVRSHDRNTGSIRNFAENTQLSYLQQISAYASHFGRSPEALGPEDVRTYQVHLVEGRKLSAASVGIATSALRFLHKVSLKRDWALEWAS